MARTQIYLRTTKKEGKIKLRFRLTDGRKIQYFHKSNIIADIAEIEKFELDGTPKKRANYNRRLADEIKSRMQLMERIYLNASRKNEKLSADDFESLISDALNPEHETQETNKGFLLLRFTDFINKSSFSKGRKAGYKVTLGILKRYLSIFGLDEITIDEVNPDFIMSFRNFIIDEYEYAKNPLYASLYADMRKANVPTTPRAQNTTAVKLKQLQAFFTVLEDSDEITKSPFRKLGRENRRISLQERYTAPTSLTLEELKSIINTDVPQDLQATKEAFILQCALGCRISDFKTMSMDNVAVTSDGVPYVRYIPQKTRHTQITLQETKTPIIRFAFDIIKNNNFNMPILNNVSGQDGYNKRIKQLLKYCHITREVDAIKDGSNNIAHLPLWETASTKLGRKTNITLLSRVQINATIGGLHSEGIVAEKHYFDRTINDLFLLMCRAFDEKPYQVNNELDVISVPVSHSGTLGTLGTLGTQN